MTWLLRSAAILGEVTATLEAAILGEVATALEEVTLVEEEIQTAAFGLENKLQLCIASLIQIGAHNDTRAIIDQEIS